MKKKVYYDRHKSLNRLRKKWIQKFIEDRAKDLLGFCLDMEYAEVNGKYEKAKDFIRSIVEEI